jgi:glutathione S-transferase
MLRLYHSPMACSLASRFALAESGLPHEVVIVRTARGEQKAEAYRRINPRGQVPALETDWGVLTESSAILPFIADLAPQAELFPQVGGYDRAQGQAWLSFLSSSLHAALAAAMFPKEGCNTPQASAAAAAVARVAQVFQDIDGHLQGRDHLLDSFSVCDLYLLVFALWRPAPVLAEGLQPMPNLDRVQQRLLARPAIAAVLGEEMKLRAEARP